MRGMVPASRPPNSMPRPGDGWRAWVSARAVPQTILDVAPEPLATLEPGMFRWRPDEDAKQPTRPSRRRALEALPEGGSVLDVGVGGGASSLGLAPKAGLIVGVDPLQGMLDLFQASGGATRAATQAVLGTWPQVASEVAPADVVVCHHAIYGVAEIEDFIVALTARARRRVVLELSTHPPLVRFDPLWKAIHHIERPDWPVADEAHRLLGAMGLAVEREDFVTPPRPQDLSSEFVAFIRRRLYVGSERDREIEEFLRGVQPYSQTMVALWWPGAAPPRP